MADCAPRGPICWQNPIITRFVSDTFHNTCRATGAVGAFNKTIRLDDRTMSLNFWDAPGQARYRFDSFVLSCIHSSSAAIVVYNITNRLSFESAIEWIHRVRSKNGSGMIVALVGNKADLSHNRRAQVTIEEATQQANRLNVVFMETSAKSGHNVQDLFKLKETATILSGMTILSTEGSQLRAALDQYLQTCSSIRDACVSGGRFNSNPEIIAGLKRASNEITSHFQKLGSARAAIHMARSSIPKVVPIIALPPGIMACIFPFAIPGQLCLVQRNIEGKISQVKDPLCPDNLAHVCSFWRRVAIGTPSLWTHIDIVLDRSLNPGLFARAKVYAVRAGQLPLEIHVSDAGSEREKKREWETQVAVSNPGPNHEWEDFHEFRFLPSNVVLIKTLEFDLYTHTRYRDIYYSVLEYFFVHSKVGVLTQYLVRTSGNQRTKPNHFIEPVDTPRSLSGALLAAPSAHLEELLLHTSSVRISGLCTHWKSKALAYCGLIELFIDKGIPEISESQFVNVLRSSPKLQVLHMKTHLGELISRSNIQPVHLEDLRDLNVAIRFEWGLWDWRTPKDSVMDLFSRGNVCRFYMAQWYSCSLVRLLSKSPRLETLVLGAFDFTVTNLSSLPDIGDFDEADSHDGDPHEGDSDEDSSDEEIKIALDRVSLGYPNSYFISITVHALQIPGASGSGEAVLGSETRDTWR
ncbi:unnamed protein product [Rhizoctonia solani]|uniref:Uncharacterized protein n=1 Tax=Rhizoctonia solani TaxID=456999 RepID=A0A8H2ZYC1_9AGAM|nr:unnamed protein product [Rhizoctonia solani]